MSKHTPGPWEQRGKRVYATGSVDTFSGPVIGAIAYCEETTQTDCEGRTWSVNGDALANARLIAAAPDMLKALEACLELEQEKANRHGYSDCCCMSWSPSTESAYENGTCPHQMARAALAKAGGRS